MSPRKLSVKRQLLAEYDSLLSRCPQRPDAAWLRLKRDRLRARGSGSLPWWAREDAKRWHITS